MLVNAATHPSPALWQGAMLVLLPIWMLAALGGGWQPTRIVLATVGYAAVGVWLLWLIVTC